MSLSIKSFTQSIRLMDPINQERNLIKKRILWPDYQVLELIHSFNQSSQKTSTQLDLSNLFIYCAYEEKFCLKKTNVKQYCQLKQCYDQQFTHMAIWTITSKQSQNSTFQGYNSSQNSRSSENRRQKSLERLQNKFQIKNSPLQIYVVLLKRPIAIDEIIKTNHKVSISIVPLSKQKFVWGGSLNYDEFQSSQNQKSTGTFLFQNSDQNFGFNIMTDSKLPTVSSSNRKSNILADKRHLRFSNYFNSKKQQKTIKTTQQKKQCSGFLKISPNHIRLHQQFLYIEVDLTNNMQLLNRPQKYSFVELNIYGRHRKPMYGKMYDDNTSTSSQEDVQNFSLQNKRIRSYLREQIFLLYRMPFFTSNSYLQSQLNFSQNQDLRQISFRGSCNMFSAMKKLQLKSTKKEQSEKSQQKQKYTQLSSLRQRSIKRKSEIDFHQSQQRVRQLNSQQLIKQQNYRKKTIDINENVGFSSVKGIKQVIQIKQVQAEKDIQLQSRVNKKSLFTQFQLLKVQYFNQINKCRNNNHCLTPQKQEQLIYFPIFNRNGFQPHRIGIRTTLISIFNSKILDKTTYVEIQQSIMQSSLNKSKNQDIQMDKPFNKKRQTIYANNSSDNKKSNFKQQNYTNKKYTKIRVFLTQRVYKEQGVLFVIQFLQRLEEIFKNDDKIKQKQQKNQDQNQTNLNSHIKQGPLCLRNMLKQIKSLQQIKNIWSLIQDSFGDGCIKNFIIIELINLLLEQSQHKSNIIHKCKTFIFQTDVLNNQNKTVTDQKEQNHQLIILKQKQVISLIKQYHNQNHKNRQFLIEIFFFIFNQCINNKNIMTVLIVEKGNKEFQKQTDFIIQNIFNQFLLLNIKQILNKQKQKWTILIQKISRILINNKQLKNEQSSQFNEIVQFFKDMLLYSIQNLKFIPINIFLNQPSQSLQSSSQSESDQNQNEQNKKQSNRIIKQNNKYRLRKFIKKYFINGQVRNSSQSETRIDSQNSYINVVTDILENYIQILNLQNQIIQFYSLNKDSQRKVQFSQIRNIIGLVKSQGKFINRRQSFLIANNYINQPNSPNQFIQFKQLNVNKQSFSQQFQFDSFKLIEKSYIIIKQQQYHISNNNNKQSVSIKLHENKLKPKYITFNSTNKNNQSQNQQTNNNENQIFGFQVIIQQNSQVQNINFGNHNQSANIYMKIYPSGRGYQKKIKNQQEDYSIDFLKTQIGVQSQIEHFGHQNVSRLLNSMIFQCYQIHAYIEIYYDNQVQSTSQKHNQQKQMSIFTGNTHIIAQNYNSATQMFSISLINNTTQYPSSSIPFRIQNIQRINVKVYFKRLPVLQNSLTFINLRLNKYIKNLISLSKSKKQPANKIQSSKKNIGGRFTEHLNRRKSVMLIQKDMFIGEKTNSKPKMRNTTTDNQQIEIDKRTSKSTLFDLPQIVLFHLFRADRSYIQDQSKLFAFIDQFYEQNQPQFQDYILYLTLRPSLLRLTSVLNHFFANKHKYFESRILQSLLKSKMNSRQKQEKSIINLFIQKPRISSIKPLKKQKDTILEKQLLAKYIKQNSKILSFSKNKQTNFNEYKQTQTQRQNKQSPLFIGKQSEKQQSKDIQI